MKDTYFITGYPGFLASNLLQQLIQDHQQHIDQIYLLVLPTLKEQALEELSRISSKCALNNKQFTLITGDITKKQLHLDDKVNRVLQQSVTHVFHLAAIYDLAVPKNIAFTVNVNGTKNINDWVITLSELKRYIYFSTAYVSGKREGRIFEHELSKGQLFRNHYEQTKYDAEILVQQIKNKVPTTIIRPGVVKGHSKTGETIKFDGLYFMLNIFDKLRLFPIIPYFGEGTAEGNFVPSDYVLQATSYLSIHPNGEGKTYHLTDPKPYKMWELQRMLSEHYLGKTPKGKIPIPVAKATLASSSIRKWLQIEPEALDYFTVHSSYDCSQAVTDLEGSGITCPDFKATIQPMIQFYRKYKHDNSRQIKIN
ncbi:NAD-dependent epimerase/dehydratase family protein [Ornithinibacillus sp. L9]|uniref:NAD-dependent epimerase/dehydratase family protein n=1 Tax=Ornithinibacillus caprae TaxID=2678566 RepID=A0A6N8FHB1_9BACI|nr:SDR family oxidoreductase [Ornithinibacillus caprae]MUK88823.1 NAD-dependent epimerase/dehydratase family protein [Ornithinibacillus caprae]